MPPRRLPPAHRAAAARAPRSLLAALALLAAGAAAAPAPPGGAYKFAGAPAFLAGGYVAAVEEQPFISTVVPAAGGHISHRLLANGSIVTNLLKFSSFECVDYNTVRWINSGW